MQEQGCPTRWDHLILFFPTLFQLQLAPYRVGIYPELALSIPQAVLDESKTPRIRIRGLDPQDDRTQWHVLKDSFLQKKGAGRAGCCTLCYFSRKTELIPVNTTNAMLILAGVSLAGDPAHNKAFTCSTLAC